MGLTFADPPVNMATITKPLRLNTNLDKSRDDLLHTSDEQILHKALSSSIKQMPSTWFQRWQQLDVSTPRRKNRNLSASVGSYYNLSLFTSMLLSLSRPVLLSSLSRLLLFSVTSSLSYLYLLPLLSGLTLHSALSHPVYDVTHLGSFISTILSEGPPKTRNYLSIKSPFDIETSQDSSFLNETPHTTTVKDNTPGDTPTRPDSYIARCSTRELVLLTSPQIEKLTDEVLRQGQFVLSPSRPQDSRVAERQIVNLT